jgi:hypothetical protein
MSILSVNYSNRVKKGNNQVIDNPGLKVAIHDEKSGKYFIPISTLFYGFTDYHNTDVHQGDLQIMTLFVGLSDNSTAKIQVKFRASGPFPYSQIILEKFPVTLPQSASEFVKEVSNLGWIIQKEKIINPTQRPLTIWIQNTTPFGVLHLNTFLNVSTYQPRPNDPPTGPSYESRVSSVGLKVAELRVERDASPQEIFYPLKVGQWTKLLVKPTESITLAWRAVAGARAHDCEIPKDLLVNIPWVEIQASPSSHFPGVFGESARSVFPPHLIPRSTPVTEHWSLIGGQVAGSWRRKVRIAEEAISEAEIDQQSSEKYFSLVSEDAENLNIVLGAAPADTPRHDCNGIFKQAALGVE